MFGLFEAAVSSSIPPPGLRLGLLAFGLFKAISGY